jgi:hypothetical protein
MFEHTAGGTQLAFLDKIGCYDVFNNKFYLGGGTALSLQLGHRKSFDLDFFSNEKFKPDNLTEIFIDEFDSVLNEVSAGTVEIKYMDISISLLYYPYKTIKEFNRYKKVNIASVEDIACMKFVAISQRAEKKDFFDIYEILKRFQFLTLKNNLTEKFKTNGFNPYHIIRSLFYFDDADNSPDPISLNGTTWEEVKNYLLKNEKKILKVFLD